MSKKLILISTSSLLAVSPLIATISCNKSSEEDVNATLTKAKDAFTLTPIKEKPITNVQASTITTSNLKEYFTETPGADFGTDKGFTYTLKSVKVNTDPTKLDVVYDISYKGATTQWTKTIEGFENVNTKLQAAKNAFTLTPIAEKPITDVQASTINDAAKLKDYFTETPGADFGTDKGFTYTYKSSTANTANSTQLDVVYEISYKGATVQWTKTIEGFSSSSNGGASQQQ